MMDAMRNICLLLYSLITEPVVTDTAKLSIESPTDNKIISIKNISAVLFPFNDFAQSFSFLAVCSNINESSG